MSTRELRAPTGPRNHSETSTKRHRLVVREDATGRYFEDFAVGDLYEHPFGRTVLPEETSSFVLLTQDTTPLHFDCRSTEEAGRSLVDGMFTLAVVTGQSVADLSMHAFADLEWERVEMPRPVFEGDTLYSRTTVLGKRRSMARPDSGILRVRTEGYNQDGAIVIRFDRSVVVCRRAARARAIAAE